MKRAALVLLAGCGRIGFADQSDANSLAVRILPAPSTLLPSAKLQLHATVDGLADQGVAWSIDEPSSGHIDQAGVYSADDGARQLHVRATSLADPSLSAAIPLDVTAAVAPVPIGDPGTIANATGLAHQDHLVHASELGRWWLFMESSAQPDMLLTRTSADFATWSDGPRLALGHTHGNDGRNLTLADRVIGGVHVVHLSVGFIDAKRGRLHVKATLDASGLAFGAPVTTNQGGATDPDGPAVAITGAGFVVDGSGWDQTPQTPPLSPCGDGDVEIYTSAEPDAGATSFDAMTYAKRVVWCVPTRVDARYLYADGETLYHVYDDGLSDPDPVNLPCNIRRADGTWLPDEATKVTPPPVFGSDAAFDIDDWSVRVAGGKLHAVRRRGTDDATLDHRELALGSEVWLDGAPMPGATGAHGSGLYLSAYSTGLVAVQIDENSQLVYAIFDGAMWSGWSSLLAPSGAARTFIAGSTASGPDDRPAITWIEGGVIVGAVLP